jgi:putative DNA primase/helicase
MWRRVIFVPWLVQVPEGERDRGLLARLKTEASGILNRLLDGVRDYLDNGMVLPEEIVAATAQFRRDSDPLGRFIEDCTVPAEGVRTQSTELYRLYQAWCVGNGEKPWSQKGVALALAERGLAQRKSSVSYWLGIRLTRRVDEFVENWDGDAAKWRPRRQDLGDGGGGNDLL